MTTKTAAAKGAADANPQPDDKTAFTFVLSPELEIANAKETLAKLEALLTENEPLRIDASGVETIDTAGLQLLVVLAREHAGVSWLNPSEAFCKTAALLGVEEHLGLGDHPRID